MIPPPQESNGWVTRILNSTSPIEIEGLGTVDGMCWMFNVCEEDGQRVDGDLQFLPNRSCITKRLFH